MTFELGCKFGFKTGQQTPANISYSDIMLETMPIVLLIGIKAKQNTFQLRILKIK
jgi:hypothetical protein